MLSQTIPALPTILALGSCHGDDQAGWHVVAILENDPTMARQCVRVASPWDIVPYLQSGRPLIVIDACRSGAPAGTLHRQLSPDAVAAGITTSSHGGSLREALQLGRSLGYDLSGVVVHGIEAESSEPDAPLSSAARRAAETLAKELRAAWTRFQA